MSPSVRMFRSISIACIVCSSASAIGYWVTGDVFHGLGLGVVIAAMFMVQGIYFAAVGGGIPLMLKFVAASGAAFALLGAGVYALLQLMI